MDETRHVLKSLLYERYRKEEQKESDRRENLPKAKLLKKKAQKAEKEFRRHEKLWRKLDRRYWDVIRYAGGHTVDELCSRNGDLLTAFGLRYDAAMLITDKKERLKQYNNLLDEYDLGAYKK